MFEPVYTKIEEITMNQYSNAYTIFVNNEVSNDINSERNIIRGNYITCGGGLAGLYFDEGSDNYFAEDNVIEGKGQVGFLMIHDIEYAVRDITVENNIVTVSSSKYIVNSWSQHGTKNKL